jgi:hypothetical protein
MWDLFGDSSQFYALVEYEKMKETFKRKVIRSFVQIARFFYLLTICFNGSKMDIQEWQNMLWWINSFIIDEKWIFLYELCPWLLYDMSFLEVHYNSLYIFLD